MRFISRMLIGSSLVAAAVAAPAGAVNVSFINPDSYWDAGSTSWDEAANLKMLSSHLQKLGQRWLPADQVLWVEVLQVDLAGSVMRFHGNTSVRVMQGGADFARIQLRYSLQAGGKPIANGEEWLSDLDSTHGIASRGDSEPLYYEKRMLSAWFKARFVDAIAAPG